MPKEGSSAFFPTLIPGQVFEPQGNEEWFLQFDCFEIVEENKRGKAKAKKSRTTEEE